MQGLHFIIMHTKFHHQINWRQKNLVINRVGTNFSITKALATKYFMLSQVL